jgi:hypothetical protein
MEIKNLKLHENNDEFRAAIREAANNLDLPEHVVEKDYWVTKVLYNLYAYKYKQYVIFKGGTSLSKGYKLINRFSEDIDLALHPDGFGKGKIHTRVSKALHRVLRDLKDLSFTDEKESQESKKYRYKRVYSFPQYFNYPENSPIHGKIVLEINSFSTPIPTEPVEIKSFVSEYLEETFGIDVLEELELKPFTIEALKPERAFCEKLLAVRRASHEGGEFFEKRIRHVYDIHQLFNSDRIKNWLNNRNDFFEMLNKCYKDDELNQKISEKVVPDFSSFDIYSNPEAKIESVKMAYKGLKDITFDKLVPEINEIANSFEDINNFLNGFKFQNE